MKIPDNVYNVLKWIAIICIPALVVFIKTVFPVWDIPYADSIATTLTSIGLLIGAIIGVSTIGYNLNQQKQADINIADMQKDLEEQK